MLRYKLNRSRIVAHSVNLTPFTNLNTFNSFPTIDKQKALKRDYINSIENTDLEIGT